MSAAERPSSDPERGRREDLARIGEAIVDLAGIVNGLLDRVVRLEEDILLLRAGQCPRPGRAEEILQDAGSGDLDTDHLVRRREGRR